MRIRHETCYSPEQFRQVKIQLSSATYQCVPYEKNTAGLPQRQGRIAPESVDSISNTIKKETEVSLGLTIFVLL